MFGSNTSGWQPRGVCAVQATPALRAAGSDTPQPPGLSREGQEEGTAERGGKRTALRAPGLRSPVSRPQPAPPLHGPRGHAGHTTRSLVLTRQPEPDVVPDAEEDRGLPGPCHVAPAHTWLCTACSPTDTARSRVGAWLRETQESSVWFQT